MKFPHLELVSEDVLSDNIQLFKSSRKCEAGIFRWVSLPWIDDSFDKTRQWKTYVDEVRSFTKWLWVSRIRC